MKIRLASLALLATCAMVPYAANAAPDINYVKPGPAKPMFVVGPNHLKYFPPPQQGAAQIPQWNGSFTDLTNKKITYTMIGSDPTATNVTTNLTVLIIPIKMIYGQSNGNMTFDPNKDQSVNKKTVTKDIAASPLFKSEVDFVEDKTDLGGGKTQYIDAFQRGNFWSTVGTTNTAYHVLFSKPKIEKEVSITVTSGQGSVEPNPFGTNKIGTYGFGAMDTQLKSFMKANSDVNPGVLPFFITDNIFLTSGGCCIGGYHDALGAQPGAQTYSYGTYVTDEKSFSQDVSALSHELGEWMDDPFVDNHVNCNDNSILEVGDPLENGPNYGAYVYKKGKSIYNLQSLVYIGYFGAPPSTSFESWLAFQDDMNHVCPGQ